MSKKIVVVGGVAGGASSAARIRRLDESAEIVMFERGPHVSFSNCSLPFYLSDIVENKEDLVLMNPEKFDKQYKIDARVNSEVVAIHREDKEVEVKNLLTGESYRESYDKLILSPGANPIVPPFEGMDKVDIFTIRNVVDIEKLKNHLDSDKVKNVTVIGGGFIGIESAENLKMAGYNVTVVEASPQIMRPFDYDMVQILHTVLVENGIDLIVEDKVEKFEEQTVVLGSGKRISADAVVLAIGVKQETSLATSAGLELGKTGAIKVDGSYRTNDKDIYAVGDAVEVHHKLLHGRSKLALAGPAQKQARFAADHIYGNRVTNEGVIGSSVIQIFDYNGASTGLTEGLIEATKMDIEYETVMVIPQDKVGLMPDANPMFFKLIYENPTGRILGAQAIGKGNVDKRIDVIATVIKFSGNLEDLRDLELCYAPPFGTAKDVVNQAGLTALNILERRYDQIHVKDVRPLYEEGAYFLDVRTPEEYENGHIKGSKHIPLCQLRDRVNEIPKDRPVYVHCRSGQRSYNAVMALQQLGFDNVKNFAGSFLALSFFEYYNDKRLDREPIVTKYCFK